MEKSLYNKLLRKSKALMEPDRMYHDFAHAKAVYLNASKLLKELGGDEIIVLTSALFHDIARDKDDHEEIGAKKLEKILKELAAFPQEKIDAVCTAVLRHEKGQKTHEEKILSDADKMDAFNELGIARGFMMASKKGYTLHKAIDLYAELLEKWYKGMHFDISRKLVDKDYKRVSGILKKMQQKYTKFPLRDII